jgi:Na+/H+ antiporter NhaC
MKKKITYITLMAVLLMTAFYIGRNTNQSPQSETITVTKEVEIPTIPENYINVQDVVNWNTDGTELSLTMADDSEYYCYK